MSSELFQLLPALYRLRDAQIAQTLTLLTPAEQAQLAALQALPPPLLPDQAAQLAELSAKATRGPLESLLLLVQEQVAAVAYDVEQLYDDQFIETCAPWVIPYIGDLIGYQPVHGIAPAIDNPRTEVANTISLRRRKGTILVIEQLARDVTAWGAHAVELFQVLATTQYMNHVRLGNHYAPDLRRWQAGVYMDTGFDRTAHKVDVRRIASGRGRYNIQNVGVFLWSLSAYSVTGATAVPATKQTPAAQTAPICYRFDSLGRDVPLFHRATPQGEEITAPAGPANVADRLRRRVLCDDLQKGVGGSYYGPGASFSISVGGTLLEPYQIRVADLSGADGSWANVAIATGTYSALVDPELGRIALNPSVLGKGAAPAVTVSYYYGFNADMGGGEYARSGFAVSDPAWVIPLPGQFPSNQPDVLDLTDAIDLALSQLALTGAVAIEISGSQPFTVTTPVIDLPANTTLEIRAQSGSRPTLLLTNEIAVSGDAGSQLLLNGLIVAAGPGFIPAGGGGGGGSSGPMGLVHLLASRPSNLPSLLSQVTITDCTLVPGWNVDGQGPPQSPHKPAIYAEPPGVSIVASRAILGPILAPELATVSLSNSIVDATHASGVAYAALDGQSGGAALTMEACTVIGKVHASLLTLVSDSILWGALAQADVPPSPWVSALVADRKQQGCVRFSFLPYNAVTPRQYECVSRALASPQPYFGSLRYGHPAYCKLLADTDDSIRRGAYSGSEMGAFNSLNAPQRETDLLIRLQEYMPVGLESGLIYQLTRNERPHR